MKLKTASLVLLCAFSTFAETNTLIVSGKANIWGAGHASVTDGVLPPKVIFTASPGKVLTFLSVNGTVDFGDGSGPVGPDDSPLNFVWSIPSSRGISGFGGAYRGGHIVGVFLDDSEPQNPAPSTLDFGAIGYNFASLGPELRQVFFVGDGLTGHGSGSTQQFVVPAAATRLYLGTPDSLYGDNTGESTATFEIKQADEPLPFISASSFTNDVFRAEVLALPGRSYILQANTNLSTSNWISLSTNVPVASPFNFSDSDAGNFASRFYRVSQEQ